MECRRTSNSVKFTGNGVVAQVRKGGLAMHQGSSVRGALWRLLILLYAGIWFQMMLTVDPLAWMPSPMLNNSNSRCVAKHKALINQLTLQWLLTSNLRTSPHPCYQAELRISRE